MMSMSVSTAQPALTAMQLGTGTTASVDNLRQAALANLGATLQFAGQLLTTLAPLMAQQFGQAPQVPMDEDRAVREIARNFGQLAGKDGKIEKDDLKEVAKGHVPKDLPNLHITPELQSAAKFMVDHNKAFKSFETADARAQGHKGHADNKIGAGDVSARLEQTGFSVG